MISPYKKLPAEPLPVMREVFCMRREEKSERLKRKFIY